MFKKLTVVILFTMATVIAYPTATLATDSDDAKTTDTTITLEVNYDADFEELLMACGFSSHDSSINAKNFPTTAKGKVKREFKVLRFDQTLESTEVVAEMKKQGFRPAGTFELIYFLSHHNKQPQIAAIGQKWQGLVVAKATIGNNSRLVFATNGSWPPKFDLLAVREANNH